MNTKADKSVPLMHITSVTESTQDLEITKLKKQIQLLKNKLSTRDQSDLLFQKKAKVKRAAELHTAKIELVFQNNEKEKRAAELVVANIELVFQNGEKEKRAAELGIANIELKFQNKEKEKRAAELGIANIELIYQNGEKEKRAAELDIANIELKFQNKEKENRAAELGIANIELVYQNGEKEKRAAELVVANIELVFQNGEKEKRAAELGIANTELMYQNGEKEKRAAELVIANIELVFQNGEKEKRAAELGTANKELLAFSYISSHDLQEPLRKIQTFATFILQTDYAVLSEKGKDYFNRMNNAAKRMQTLIIDLLEYSRTNIADRKFETADLEAIVKEVCEDLAETIAGKKAKISIIDLGSAYINKFQFRQLITNLLSNALKFSKPDITSEITFTYRKAPVKQLEKDNPELSPGTLSVAKKYCHLSIIDNGIGYDSVHKDKIFEVFKRLHHRDQYAGTGIGLAIVKKIVDNHNGIITSTSESGKGASFDIYIPELDASG